MSIGSFLEPLILDAVFNGGNVSIAATYAKLHIGDPGDDGTSNPAGETTRKAMSWGAASGGMVVTDTDLVWSAVSSTEELTHLSVWDAATSGNHLWNGPLDATYPVNGGDPLTIPAGVVVVTLT